MKFIPPFLFHLKHLYDNTCGTAKLKSWNSFFFFFSFWTVTFRLWALLSQAVPQAFFSPTILDRIQNPKISNRAGNSAIISVRSTQPHTGGARDHFSLAEHITALPSRDVAIETSNYIYRGTGKKKKKGFLKVWMKQLHGNQPWLSEEMKGGGLCGKAWDDLQQNMQSASPASQESWHCPSHGWHGGLGVQELLALWGSGLASECTAHRAKNPTNTHLTP